MQGTAAPVLLQALALPASAQVGQRIAKKLLTEQIAALKGSTAADKRFATDQLEDLHWLAALKPSTVGLAAWQTDTHDYLEVAVLHAHLRPAATKPSATSTAQLNRLVQLIHRVIPYPVVLITTQATPSGVQEQLSLAHKRRTLSSGSAMVLEQLVSTPWLAQTDLQDAINKVASHAIIHWPTAQFLINLALSNPQSTTQRHLHARYDGWLQSIEALAAAARNGRFALCPTPTEAASRRSALQHCAQLDAQLASLRTQASKASQLAQRAALNLKIADLMAQRQAMESQL
jgi:Domain of unknown function (DUF4391)